MLNDKKIDRIKRKVSKLLALAMGTSNKHEADNALKKAAALMASYHVSEGDLSSPIIVVRKHFSNGRKMAMAAELLLFHGICKNMGVYSLYRTTTRETEYTHGEPCQFSLVGNACDIEIAWYMFETCLNQMVIETKAYRLKGKANGETITRAMANDYKNGLAIGLCYRFEKMAKADIPAGKGLVPVDTRRNDAGAWYLDNVGGVSKGCGLSMRNSSHRHDGQRDSKNIRINAGVNHSSKTALLQ
jgi:hypothetical protein